MIFRRVLYVQRSLPPRTMSTFSFTFQHPQHSTHFGPRLGRLEFKRSDEADAQTILTPALITTTSRGIVPHLSRDHVAATPSIGWTQVHFETLYVCLPVFPRSRLLTLPQASNGHRLFPLCSKDHIPCTRSWAITQKNNSSR